MRRHRKQKGFTLVEILIVVIILGILAAIVIPQFTNASEDARKNSLSSQLQTLRSQVELFKVQHDDNYPTADLAIASAWDWTKLTGKTTEAGVATGGTLGPYMQNAPTNSLNNLTTVQSVATDPTPGTTTSTAGYVFSQASGKIFATDKNGTVLNQ